MNLDMEPTTNATSEQSLRLIRVLNDRRQAEGNYAALARAIADAQPRGGKSIDRRKLRLVLEGNPDSLTLADLRKLDRYLEGFGQGLAFHPLFEKPALLQSLAASPQVTFLIGSKSDEGVRQYFSHWDVLGMAEIQRGINACGTNVCFDIQEVSRDPENKGLPRKREPWSPLLGDQGPSLVCLGSSRTTPAAESMARAMFGGKPFGENLGPEKASLPFHFIWNKHPNPFDSPFHLDRDEIGHIDPKAAALLADGEASAIKVGEEIVVDQVGEERGGEAYGVCVAQRRKNGQVWLLVAGITGIATYVGAKMTSQIAIHLNDTKQVGASPVYWSVIRAKVDKPSKKRPLYSVRNFPDETVWRGPTAWHPTPV